MGYFVDIYHFLNSTEYEYKFIGKYGAKGEKRGKKEKPTPEQIKKQNQRNRENRVRRLIKRNFCPNDLWVTLKYQAGVRKPPGEVKKEFRAFLDSLRREYKKRGEPLKYIYRMEIGERGGIHIHILINRLRGAPDTDVIVQTKWTHGRANFTSIYEDGGYKALAEYIVKQPSEKIEEKMSQLPPEERKLLISYNSSRNLIRPEPERKEYKTRTMKKIMEQVAKDGKPEAKEGFYIDRDSIRCGVNPYTGMSYLHYTECRIVQIERPEEGG